VVEDGQDALDYIFCKAKYAHRDINQLPALILLDLKLPKIDGLEVLRRIRTAEIIKRLPVVILTSSKRNRNIAISYDLGVNSYIRKPVDFNQFAEAVSILVYIGLLSMNRHRQYNRDGLYLCVQGPCFCGATGRLVK